MSNELIIKYLVDFYGKGDIPPEHLSEQKEYKKLNKIAREINYRIRKVQEECKGISPDDEKEKWELEECLKTFHKMRKDYLNPDTGNIKEKLDLFNELVGAVFFNSWKKENQIHYNDCIKKLNDLKEYFLSYTNKEYGQTNDIFKAILKNVRRKEVRDNKEKNKVAAYLAYLLQSERIIGYYDCRELRCGDDFKESIYEACNNSVCFVQLIERATWMRHPKDGKNWCHLEWLEFRRNNSEDNKREIYIILSKNALGKSRLGEFQYWHDTIRSTEHSLTLSKKNLDKFSSEIIKLSKLINLTVDEYVNELIRFPSTSN